MEFQIRNKFLTLIIFSLIFYSCKNQNENCYSIEKIIVPQPDHAAGVNLYIYSINSETLINKISGELLVGNIYESNVSRIKIYNDDELIEIKTAVKIKEFNNKKCVFLGSSTYKSNDSLWIKNKIKNYRLVLELKNGSIYKLNNCNNILDIK